MKLIYKLLSILLFFVAIDAYSTTIYVMQTAQGSNTGISWEDAFTSFQDAIIFAQYGDSIWIAEGNYKPTTSMDRYISFEIPNGVSIFGGFAGFETQLSQRDWENHPSILSGDIGIQGDHSDNSFSVLTAEGTDTLTTLDGVIVTSGNANSQVALESQFGNTKSGGGLHLNDHGGGNPAFIRIYNCTFLDNRAQIFGGAIFCAGIGGSTGFVIYNCRFENNESNGSGGAIGKQGGCISRQILSSCIFESNRSDDFGGAYSCTDINSAIDLQIENCSFINNEAEVGGAFSRTDYANSNSNDLIFNNCLFENNKSENYGGAINMDISFSTGEVFLNKCHFFKNHAGTSGGAMYGGSGFLETVFTISQCSFIQNKANNGAATLSLSKLKLNSLNNQFIKNEALIGACFIFNGNSTVDIINNTFYQNKVLSANAIFKATGGEVTVLNSIFWENEALNNNTFRLSNAILEIGACVFDSGTCDSLLYQNPFGDSSQIICQPDVLFDIYPQFRDTANYDFSLLSCSPAVNAGQTFVVDSYNISEDIAGNDRLLDEQIDIGAYEQTAFLVNIDSIQHVTCKGFADGIVFLNAQGTMPVEVLWQTNNDTGPNTTNLQPGNYTFIISDADACIDSIELEITEADSLLTLQVVADQSNCPNSDDGNIVISPLGGVPPFQYAWSNGENGSVLENLSPDIYVVTVSDANNCTSVETIPIDAPPVLGVNFIVVQATSAIATDGSITIDSIFGGTPGYNFLWSNGETTPSLNNLLPGHYELTITDSNNCNYIYGFQINFTIPIVEIDYYPVQIVPNPADEFLSITFHHAIRSNSYFSLYNTLGQEILKTEIPIGQKDYQISISSIPAGGYSYLLKEENLVISTGIISIIH